MQVKAITEIIMAVYLENQEVLERLDFMKDAACAADPSIALCTDFFQPDPSTQGSGLTIQILDSYLPSLAADGALDDCWVTPVEISRNPAAADFLSTFILSTAAAQGIAPTDVVVGALSTDGDNTPGCNGQQIVVPPLPQADPNDHVIHIDPSVSANFGDAAAWSDCFLDPTEIAANTNAQAWIAAFQHDVATNTGVNSMDVIVSGISLDSDSEPGCAAGFSGRRMLLDAQQNGLLKGHAFTGPHVTRASHRMLSVDIAPSPVGKIAEHMGGAAFKDGRLTEDELANDADASVFAKDVKAKLCAHLGLEGEACKFSLKDLQGVTPELRARAELMVPLEGDFDDAKIVAATKAAINSLSPA